MIIKINSIGDNFVKYFPLLMLIPYNIAITIPGLPMINLVRIFFFVFLVIWLTSGDGFNKIIWLIKNNLTMRILSFTYFIISVISIFSSSDTKYALMGFFNEAYFFVPFFFAIGYFHMTDKNIIIKCLKLIIIIMMFSNLFLVIQLITGIDYYSMVLNTIAAFGNMNRTLDISGNLEIREGYARYSGSMGHSLSMGVFFASFVFIYIMDLSYKIIVKSRIYLYLIIISSFYVVYLSHSRTPIFLMLMILILFIFSKKLKPGNIVLLILTLVFINTAYIFLEGIGLGIERDSGRELIFNEFLDYLGIMKFFGIGPAMFKLSRSPELLQHFTIIDPMAEFMNKTIEIGYSYIISIILIILIMFKGLFKLRYIEDLFMKDYTKLLFAIIFANILASVTSVTLFSGGLPLILTWILFGSYTGILNKV